MANATDDPIDSDVESDLVDLPRASADAADGDAADGDAADGDAAPGPDLLEREGEAAKKSKL